jgi:hypothetical protein
MKEGLINLPEDVVILQEIVEKTGVKFIPLSLADIPDSEAETVKRAIDFVKSEMARGNNYAGGSFDFGHGPAHTSYRVVSARSNDAIGKFLPFIA